MIEHMREVHKIAIPKSTSGAKAIQRGLLDCKYAVCHRRGQYGFGSGDEMRKHMGDVHNAA